MQSVSRTRQFGEEPRNFTQQNQVTVNASSHIWQPWFIGVQADVDMAYETQRGGTSGGDSILLAGGTNLAILPLSRYPSTLSYRHTDNRVDGRFSGSDFVSDRVAITSQANFSTDLRTSLLASYQTSDQGNDGREEQNRVRVNVLKQFTTDRLALSLDFGDEDFVSDTVGDESETEVIGRLVYDSRPFINTTMQMTSTGIYETDETRNETTDRAAILGLSTMQWRPEDKPFTVNGALRTLAENIDTDLSGSSGSSTKTVNKLVNGTIGLNYPISPRLTANAGLNGRIQSLTTEAGSLIGEQPSTSDTDFGASFLGNINYQSLPVPVKGFDWRWDARGSTNISAETEEGFTDDESASLGHSIDRSLSLIVLSPVLLRASEEISLSTDNDERFAADLDHNVSLTHSSATGGVATFIRASASDRRSLFPSDGSEFQLIQLQLNRQASIDLTSSWFANLSLQVSRQKTGEGDADTVASANGTVSYRNIDIFGVRNLRFNSELTLSALGLESVVTGDDDDKGRSERFRSDWTNVLEYRIGRLIVSLEGTIVFDRQALERGERNSFGNEVFIRIRREFGGGPP